MKVLCIYAAHNKEGINKATGQPWRDSSHVFRPEAFAFKKMHGGDCFSFDNRLSLQERRAEVESILEHQRGARYNGVAFFCHGLKSSLQTGHTIETLRGLVTGLTGCVAAGAFVVLYACDAADTRIKNAPGGDGGFADKLRDALIKEDLYKWVGGHVDAHVTTGHATRNPNVRRFYCTPAVPSEEVLGIVGGQYIVEPGSGLWPAWRKSLNGEMRFKFPSMPAYDIRKFLRKTA